MDSQVSQDHDMIAYDSAPWLPPEVKLQQRLKLVHMAILPALCMSWLHQVQLQQLCRHEAEFAGQSKHLNNTEIVSGWRISCLRPALRLPVLQALCWHLARGASSEHNQTQEMRCKKRMASSDGSGPHPEGANSGMKTVAKAVVSQ